MCWLFHINMHDPALGSSKQMTYLNGMLVRAPDILTSSEIHLCIADITLGGIHPHFSLSENSSTVSSGPQLKPERSLKSLRHCTIRALHMSISGISLVIEWLLGRPLKAGTFLHVT